MLTIGEVARLSGLTVRAVRHYHQRGLLPEPERDHSGYRRYVAADVVTLIRIKTLAEAGVPLSRVAELLAADEQEFAGAVAEIDARLLQDEWDLQLRRKRVAALVAGDGLALPEEVVAYLGGLREAGLPERVVELERDAWILLSAHVPEHVPDWIALKQRQLETEDYREFLRRLDAAHDWDPDDPRLVELADFLAAALGAMSDQAEAELGDSDAEALDARVVAVLDEQFLGASAAWARLNRLLDERGWEGWTAMQRRE